MINNFTPRLYQQTILGTAVQHNTLVVLPTGLGKTAIAFLVAAQRLHSYPNSKILMLAPTKPLCEQHVTTFQNHIQIDPEKIILFTGSIAPKKREALWKEAQIIISTPQGLENDVINKRIKLEEVSLIIFDEAHHATGEYSYVWIADQYEKKARHARILALTASPASDLEKVKEVCQNLHVEKVEVRTETDHDVKQYIQPIKKKWVKVQLPVEFKKIQTLLKTCQKAKLLEMQKLGTLNSTEVRKTDLLKLQGEFQRKISSGERDFEILRSISLAAEALKVEHAIELLETQGLTQVLEYLSDIRAQARTSKTKAVKNLAIDEFFKGALVLTESTIEKKIQHPKITELLNIIKSIIIEKPNAKIIIFTQFRSSASQIVETLEQNMISTHIFLGQAKKNGKGFSQKQQKEILDQFRKNEFNILVATSVAEEGLDIPKVDKVLFYEPVPSAIRTIQRRGRTGRLDEGAVTILVTEGTRDEGYRWSAHHKEKRMYRNLEKLKKEFTLSPKKQTTTLQQFIPKEQVVSILADHREKDNKIVKELIDLGVSVKTAQLENADYILSGKVGVELKKRPDFVSSIIDGRLLDQIKYLSKEFDKAVVIIEGEEDMYSLRKVHANAIRGMLATITLSYGVPILYTKNPRDTAALLAVMAKREQEKTTGFSYHSEKPNSGNHQLEFIVSSLPNIGPNMAKKLLEHFKTIKNLTNASIKDITTIEGIGKKTAERISEVLNKEYNFKK